MRFIKYQKIPYCVKERQTGGRPRRKATACFLTGQNGFPWLAGLFLGVMMCLQGGPVAAEQSLPFQTITDSRLGQSWSFPENWETRRAQLHMLTAPLAYGPNGMWGGQHLQKHYPAQVHYWLEIEDQAFFYLFSFSDKSGKRDHLKKGTISVKRSRADGAFLAMTILLADIPETQSGKSSYVRFYPAGQKVASAAGGKGRRPELDERVVLELVFRGKTLCKEQILPVTFEQVLGMPFSTVRELTAKTINWELLLAPGSKDETIMRLVGEIRRHLDLTYEEDAAFDEQGKSVHIRDLSPAGGGVNCSGFVKWVIDGLYYPFAGQYLPIAPLKEKPLAIRGDRWSTRYEEARDPFFGLDWSRNLVFYLAEARTGQKLADKELFDVRELDFFDYKEDVGYQLADLELILYLLAKKRPGYFYIGSINHEYRASPRLRQHTHLVLFFPHFISSSQYQLVVMESGSETGLANAVKRFPGEYVHLVAVNAQGPLELLPVKNN